MSITTEDAVNAGKALGALEAELIRFEMSYCQSTEGGGDYFAKETQQLRDAARRVMQSFALVLAPRPFCSRSGEPPLQTRGKESGSL